MAWIAGVIFIVVVFSLSAAAISITELRIKSDEVNGLRRWCITNKIGRYETDIDGRTEFKLTTKPVKESSDNE